MNNYNNVECNYPASTQRTCFVHESEGVTIYKETTHEICHDVVLEFYYFMLGSGYDNKSILRSFEAIVEEFPIVESSVAKLYGARDDVA
ncbi:MAG: hypothetical protein ACO4CS_03860 [bacterium]|jgi:hypothetical protein